MDYKDQLLQVFDWVIYALVYNFGPSDVIPDIQLVQKVR